MKKIVVTAVAALALTGGAAEAQAFDWDEAKSKSVWRSVGAGSCVSAGHVDVPVPAGARNAEAVSPQPGRQFEAWERGDGEGSGPVQVTGVVNVGSALRFTVEPVGDWCRPTETHYEVDPGLAEYGDDGGYSWTDYDEGWESEWEEKFSVRYQVRKRIVMTRGLARNLAAEALSRRFSWFGDANHGGYRCQVSGNRGRCEHGFVIGDGAVMGVVVSRLIGRSGRKPVWSYRLSGVQIDEYCRYVTHAGNCSTRFKKRRSRVSLPYWVRAKTV
jgi:hypothetical protein